MRHAHRWRPLIAVEAKDGRVGVLHCPCGSALIVSAEEHHVVERVFRPRTPGRRRAAAVAADLRRAIGVAPSP